MLKIYLLLFAAAFFSLNSQAQEVHNINTNEDKNPSPLVNIYVDPRLDGAANKPKPSSVSSTAPGSNNSNKALRQKGFRVQIYNGTNKADAEKTKRDFIRIYPKMRSYLTFQSPNYKLKVGDFRSRAEAEEFLETAARLFRNTMIIPDIINNN